MTTYYITFLLLLECADEDEALPLPPRPPRPADPRPPRPLPRLLDDLPPPPPPGDGS